MKRFFRSPKGLLTIVFAPLLAVAIPYEGAALVLPGLLTASASAMAVDLLILRWRDNEWEFPSGAMLTAFIVVMVLSPQEPWWVAVTTSVVGVLSKYVARVRTANVFNPAALALVASYFLFQSGQSWWGAMTDAPAYAIAVLVSTGVFITDRVNKMPMVLTFLGVYYLLFTVTAFVSDATPLVEIYRTPDLQMVLYFAFFMLTDPPTSPVKHRHQVMCGVLVAVVSYAVFEVTGAVYYLLAGILAGNLWEAGRRIWWR